MIGVIVSDTIESFEVSHCEESAMSPQDIHELLHEQPFRAFRIHLSNGATYDVRHPELAMVGETTLLIGKPVPDAEYPIFKGYHTVALAHINNVEPLPASTPTGNGPG